MVLLDTNLRACEGDDDLDSQRRSMPAADIRLLLDVSVHKQVLMENSGYFKALYERDYMESNTKEIDMTEFDAFALIQVMNFMYTKKVEVNVSNVGVLVKIASYFMVEELRDLLERFMQETYSVSNCIAYYFVAYEHGMYKVRLDLEHFIDAHFHHEIIFQKRFVRDLSADHLSHVAEKGWLKNCQISQVLDLLGNWFEYKNRVIESDINAAKKVVAFMQTNTRQRGEQDHTDLKEKLADVHDKIIRPFNPNLTQSHKELVQMMTNLCSLAQVIIRSPSESLILEAEGCSTWQNDDNVPVMYTLSFRQRSPRQGADQNLAKTFGEYEGVERDKKGKKIEDPKLKSRASYIFAWEAMFKINDNEGDYDLTVHDLQRKVSYSVYLTNSISCINPLNFQMSACEQFVLFQIEEYGQKGLLMFDIIKTRWIYFNPHLVKISKDLKRRHSDTYSLAPGGKLLKLQAACIWAHTVLNCLITTSLSLERDDQVKTMELLFEASVCGEVNDDELPTEDPFEDAEEFNGRRQPLVVFHVSERRNQALILVSSAHNAVGLAVDLSNPPCKITNESENIFLNVHYTKMGQTRLFQGDDKIVETDTKYKVVRYCGGSDWVVVHEIDIASLKLTLNCNNKFSFVDVPATKSKNEAKKYQVYIL